MDQAPKPVRSFSAALHFADGSADTIVVTPAVGATIYYREVESWKLNERHQPTERTIERTITWTTKEPWTPPEQRGEMREEKVTGGYEFG